MTVFLELAASVRRRLPHLREDTSQRQDACPRMPCFSTPPRPVLALLGQPWWAESPQDVEGQHQAGSAQPSSSSAPPQLENPSLQHDPGISRLVTLPVIHGLLKQFVHEHSTAINQKLVGPAEFLASVYKYYGRSSGDSEVRDKSIAVVQNTPLVCPQSHFMEWVTKRTTYSYCQQCGLRVPPSHRFYCCTRCAYIQCDPCTARMTAERDLG